MNWKVGTRSWSLPYAAKRNLNFHLTEMGCPLKVMPVEQCHLPYPFLKGETTLAAACRMHWRGARLETRRKIRRLAAAIVKETDDGGQTIMMALEMERSEGIRGRLTKKGQQITGLWGFRREVVD